MRKAFALNQEPHVAEIGDQELEFQPEVMGDEFLDAYAEMRDRQKAESGVDVEDLKGGDAEDLRKVTGGLRIFLSRLMLPDSAKLITQVDVRKDGNVLETFYTWEEGRAYADEHGGTPRWAFRVPDRILVQLLDWTVELYSGGRRPPTSSGASAAPSRKAGTRSTGASRSKGSTRTSGR